MSLNAGCAQAPAEARNLLLVTIDTLRADHLGIYGGAPDTPTLDALAAEGVAVGQAFTPTPTTGPAHASLFTGLHPWRHGVLANAVPLGRKGVTLAEVLRGAGWTTSAIVASYVLHPRFGFDRGFDHYRLVATEGARWEGERHERFWAPARAVTQAATARLSREAEASREAPGRKGFFLWVHYFDPHLPYDPPAALSVAPDAPVDLEHRHLPPKQADEEGLRELLRAYRGEVRYVDQQLGVLLAELDRDGLADSTAVVVVADHGEGLGNHGLLDHGRNLFEELIRVPLVVRAPGVPARGRIEGIAQLEDLLPTLLGLVGEPAPQGVDGLDLAPWLRGQVPDSPRDAALGRIKAHAGLPAIHYHRADTRKWIGTLGSPGRLYLLEPDPLELVPVPAAGAPGALLERAADASEGAARLLDPRSRRALEALGYLEPVR